MFLIKNRQYLVHFMIDSIIGTACSLIGWLAVSWQAGVLCAVTGTLIIVMDFIYTRKRYQAISRLSDYLHCLAGGDESLALPDYEEGELSILKTGIYKTATKLRFQAEALRGEKVYLADALADISHQLKTPVTSMMVMSDLLKNTQLEVERRTEFLANIDRQLEKTQWIITNLLKLSKIDSGQIQFRKEPFSLAEVVAESIASFQIIMELKSQELLVEGEADTLLVGDRNWTGEAVANLVKNCVEHTADGGQVRITYRRTPLYTLLTIADNGHGIEKEDLPHIFERFYKGKNAAPDSVGIGLALAKTIFNRQNARIEVESVPGEGTCFEIRFYGQII